MTDQTKRGRGRPRTGFDKKQYDRDRMKSIRAKAKLDHPNNETEGKKK